MVPDNMVPDIGTGQYGTYGTIWYLWYRTLWYLDIMLLCVFCCCYDLVTKQNNSLAVLDGFAYRKHKLNNAKTTQYWRCVNVQKGCRGCAVEEAGSREVRMTQDHSDGCGAFENGVSLELRKLRTSVKRRVANTGTRGSPVREVVSQEVAAASLSEEASMKFFIVNVCSKGVMIRKSKISIAAKKSYETRHKEALKENVELRAEVDRVKGRVNDMTSLVVVI
ncbi:hypothetical protein L596_011351 [Steinernema carpocapsae]|uniref:FLYWCH-type domain-containing protein n=1 Tax=Steinernema carpocapsae TaxID=34508 RepID=A0A4U5NUE5_STECR|nr:hypothetical protein L596_011351 [Steinernema carpocapsae]